MSTILPHMVWPLCKFSMSETCCTLLAENTGHKTDKKIRHLGTIPPICRAISWQLRHVSTMGQIIKQQYRLHRCLQCGALRRASGWDRFVTLGTPAYFNGFRVLAAFLHGTPVLGVSQLCSVEHSAPPMFSRAAITLGIGPHFKLILSCTVSEI